MKKNTVLKFLIALLASAVFGLLARATIIPDARRTVWQPGLTYNGGIPNRTTIYTTLTPSGGSDDAAIQNAINNCPDEQVILFGAGTFHLTGDGLAIERSNITLRGAGPANTTIIQSVHRPVFNVGWASYHWAQQTLFATDGVKGTNTVTLVSNPGLQVGQIVHIDETYDSTLTWYDLADGQDGDYQGWGEGRLGPQADSRPIGQAMVISAINGNQITFSTPFHMNFRTSHAAHLARIAQNNGTISMPVTRVGIEDLCVSNGGQGDGSGNIKFFCATYCWAKNIESKFSQGASVGFDGSFRCELRDSYLHETINPNPGGDGYGLVFDTYAADNLAENNISWNFNKVMVMRGTGGGNVIGYNYMQDGYGGAYPNAPENGLNASHMTTPHMELFEGNESFNFSGDSRWGNSIYITAFRNHATGQRTAASYLATYTYTDPTTGGVYYFEDEYNRRAMGISRGHYWYNFVGNVLGYPGQTLLADPRSNYKVPQTAWEYDYSGNPNNVPMWMLDPVDPQVMATAIRHGNYDFATTSTVWDPANSDHALPTSLYLTAKPAFFGSNPWPWVTGENSSNPLPGILPAKARFDSIMNPVPTAPAIMTPPVSQTVAIGYTATFTVAASGYPTPTFQWYKAGGIISGATSSYYVINNVQTSNAGDYNVVATNSVGAATSNAATLTVIPVGTLLNASFETPALSAGGYQYNPTGGTWIFASNAGIVNNGSGFGNPTAPDGVQVAFLQGQGGTNGTITQSMTFTAGSHTLSFQACQRNFGGLNSQTIRVLIDGTQVSIITPSMASFETYTTTSFTTTAAAHTIQFAGGSTTGDQTAFIDSIAIDGSTPPSPPSAPTGLAATASNAQVVLNWNASSGATSYNVYRGTTAGGESTTAIVTGVTATTYTNTGLTNGTTYYYEVKAVNANGSSAYSNEASATPAVAGPLTNVSFETPALSAGGYQYNPTGGTWIFASNAGIANNSSAFNNPTAPDGVQVAFLQGQAGTNGTITQSATFTAGSHTLSFQACQRDAGGVNTQTIRVLIDGTLVSTISPTTASFAVYTTTSFTTTAGAHAIQFAGGSTTNDQTAFIDSVVIDSPSAPPAPTGLTATAGNAQVALSWTASSGATSYNVYRGTTAGGESTTAIVTGVTGTTYTNTGRTNGTTYYYKVAAVNAGGTSAYSNEASATPVAAPPAPTGLTATAGNTQVVLNWNASVGALTYNVYRGTTANGESTTAIATGITATTYTNTGRTNGTTYYYKVKAVNGGTSAYSNEASATPTAGGGNSVTNASFETPALSAGGYQYNPTGGTWTFASNAGIANNSSAFNNPTAPNGVQVAFLQGQNGTNGTITQSATFTAGSHTLSFQACQRNSGFVNTQTIRVLIDGTQVSIITPSTASFAAFSTTSFTTTAGAHTIQFAGGSTTDDQTAFIDSVVIN
jgi:fibronectin type 3 domain-containing protein